MVGNVIHQIAGTLQILDCLAMRYRIGYLASGTLTDIAIYVDDVDFIGHVYLRQVHTVKHLLDARLPYFFVA